MFLDGPGLVMNFESVYHRNDAPKQYNGNLCLLKCKFSDKT